MDTKKQAQKTRRQLSKLGIFFIAAVIIFTGLGIYAYFTPKPYKFVETQVEFRKRDHPQGIGTVQ